MALRLAVLISALVEPTAAFMSGNDMRWQKDAFCPFNNGTALRAEAGSNAATANAADKAAVAKYANAVAAGYAAHEIKFEHKSPAKGNLVPVRKTAKQALQKLHNVRITLTHVAALQKVNARRHPREPLRKDVVELQQWTKGAESATWSPLIQPTLDKGLAALVRLSDEKRYRHHVDRVEKRRAAVLKPDSSNARRPYKYDKQLDRDYVSDPKMLKLAKELEHVKWQAADADRAHAHKDLEEVVRSAMTTLSISQTAHDTLQRVSRVKKTAGHVAGWESALKRDVVIMHKEVTGSHGKRLQPILDPSINACLTALTGLQNIDAKRRVVILARFRAEQEMKWAAEAKLKADKLANIALAKAKASWIIKKRCDKLLKQQAKERQSGSLKIPMSKRHLYKTDPGLDLDYPFDAQQPGAKKKVKKALAALKAAAARAR